MLTTRISPYTVGALPARPRRQPERAARTQGHTGEILLYITTRHTPLSHCPLPVGYTTCNDRKAYWQIIRIIHPSNPLYSTQGKSPKLREKNKKKRRSKRPKETIYIYFLFFLLFLREFPYAVGKIPTVSHRPNCYNFIKCDKRDK